MVGLARLRAWPDGGAVSTAKRKRRVYVPGSERKAAGGIVLPGDARRGMSTLHVPRGYESDPENAPVLVGVCLVPGCDREGAPFYRGQEDQWQQHTGWCARRHRDEIAEAIQERKDANAIFQRDAWDPELRDHMDKVGKRMIEEGRLVVKPNERAGF